LLFRFFKHLLDFRQIDLLIAIIGNVDVDGFIPVIGIQVKFQILQGFLRNVRGVIGIQGRFITHIKDLVRRFTGIDDHGDCVVIIILVVREEAFQTGKVKVIFKFGQLGCRFRLPFARIVKSQRQVQVVQSAGIGRTLPPDFCFIRIGAPVPDRNPCESSSSGDSDRLRTAVASSSGSISSDKVQVIQIVYRFDRHVIRSGR
jgi:hypothetical protein